MKDCRRDQWPHLPDPEIIGFLEHTVTNSSKARHVASGEIVAAQSIQGRGGRPDESLNDMVIKGYE